MARDCPVSTWLATQWSAIHGQRLPSQHMAGSGMQFMARDCPVSTWLAVGCNSWPETAQSAHGWQWDAIHGQRLPSQHMAGSGMQFMARDCPVSTWLAVGCNSWPEAAQSAHSWNRGVPLLLDSFTFILDVVRVQ